jgi:sodium/hydrogen exchanger 8
MAHYCKPIMAKVARERTGAFFKVLATLAETFVFLYIGSSLFMQQQGWEQGRIASLVVS